MRWTLFLVAMVGCGGGGDLCKVGNHCAGNTLMMCDGVGGQSQKDCTACVQGASDAFCAESASPSPLCAGATRSSCDGAARVDCTEGYRVKTTTCATDGMCQTSTVDGQKVGVCALSAAKDATCNAAVSGGRDAYCTGDTLTQCYAGFDVQTVECMPVSTGTACGVTNGVGSCRGGNGDTMGDPYGY
jgi:hypothetical protein